MVILKNLVNIVFCRLFFKGVRSSKSKIIESRTNQEGIYNGLETKGTKVAAV